MIGNIPIFMVYFFFNVNFYGLVGKRHIPGGIFYFMSFLLLKCHAYLIFIFKKRCFILTQNCDYT